MKYLSLIFLLCTAGALWGSEVMPPPPAHYFNDYAQVVNPGVANGLNLELEQFEKATSSQLVVAIFPTMQTDSSLEDYAQRIFQAWGVGQKKLNNGAILLVFVKEHKMRIQTGYGLEGALPDITCKRIIEDEIAPHLRVNDFSGGMAAGVHAMIQAAKGEYKGTGRTVNQQRGGDNEGAASWIVPVFIFVIFILITFARTRGTALNSRGRSTYTPWNSGYGGGGGWSSGDGGGGFSGGGGSSGGGGASGSW